VRRGAAGTAAGRCCGKVRRAELAVGSGV
jgi:hypothetical protein